MPHRYVSYGINTSPNDTQELLETASLNNMDVKYRESVETIARYVKTNIHMLSFRIMNRETNKMDNGLLKTSISKEWFPGAELEFWYPDEVIELYEGDNVALFERMNRSLLDEGTLIPYDNNVEYVWACRIAGNEIVQKGVTPRYEYFLSEKIKDVNYTLVD